MFLSQRFVIHGWVVAAKAHDISLIMVYLNIEN
jgi:hypothetical protein